MKIKEGFLLRCVGDHHIVVPVGSQSVDFRCIITLNDTGAFIWEHLQQPCTAEELVAALLAEYDVPADVAAADVDTYIAALREKNLLDE